MPAAFCEFCGAPLSQLETAGQPKSRRSCLPWVFLLLLVSVSIVFALVGRDWFFRFVSLSGTALLVFSVILMIRTLGKVKRVRLRSVLISAVFSVACLGIFAWLMNARISIPAALLSVMAGLIVGSIQGLALSVRVVNGELHWKGGAWHLLLWLALLAVNQLVPIFTHRSPVVLFGFLLMGTGVVLGHAGTLFLFWFGAKGRVT